MVHRTRYRDRRSFRRITDPGAIRDLEIEPREVFGFLEPIGAGKSTTMRVLLDLIKPTSGRASVLGLDTRENSLEIRRRVGFLPDDFALYPSLTGAKVLDYLAELRGGIDRRNGAGTYAKPLGRARRGPVATGGVDFPSRLETFVERMLSVFARVQTLHQPADKLEGVTEAAREQLPALHELAGFKGCYYLIDRDNEKALVISLWETEEDLRRFEANTAQRERTAAQVDIKPPPSEIFEVALQAT